MRPTAPRPTGETSSANAACCTWLASAATRRSGGDRTNLRPCRQPALRAVGPAHDRCAIAHMRRSRYMKSRSACPQGRIGRSAGARAARQRSVFAAVRVRAAHNRQAHDEQWLLIEWPPGESEPRHYWFSTLPKQTPVKTLVATAHGRWRIERDYQELKSELGLHHYEGRNWRGFHHHASLCIAAYGFLMRERLRSKKNSVAFKMPAVSKSVRPRGSGPNATSPSQLDCHAGLRTG